MCRTALYGRRTICLGVFVTGDGGVAAFKYLMASGAKYNQQAWKELGDLPPQPVSPAKLTDLQQKQSINLKATT